ncbi:hypothetical protein JZ751_008993 [Albula glossodonta]|uniref:Uncharacterized protein n=1 Tax=Albula glossodonta TaxID=121402 RepID=A0A8T2PAW3_9TELE|nr:hypothetical protein JZ751_008993 [Albula glossodonta]
MGKTAESSFTGEGASPIGRVFIRLSGFLEALVFYYTTLTDWELHSRQTAKRPAVVEPTPHFSHTPPILPHSSHPPFSPGFLLSVDCWGSWREVLAGGRRESKRSRGTVFFSDRKREEGGRFCPTTYACLAPSRFRTRPFRQE